MQESVRSALARPYLTENVQIQMMINLTEQEHVAQCLLTKFTNPSPRDTKAAGVAL